MLAGESFLASAVADPVTTTETVVEAVDAETVAATPVWAAAAEAAPMDVLATPVAVAAEVLTPQVRESYATKGRYAHPPNESGCFCAACSREERESAGQAPLPTGIGHPAVHP